ncbi:hypothetical protein PIB30_026614 [Stylosanthes scabra]|uniref:Uncharacterized protein n=1 Tax=Stylosanthes scabra TaxID=79078 RepID=A0ABU6W8Y5_9FABA|nr:hypothetical protein [Stylosanthes scabra]
MWFNSSHWLRLFKKPKFFNGDAAVVQWHGGNHYEENEEEEIERSKTHKKFSATMRTSWANSTINSATRSSNTHGQSNRAAYIPPHLRNRQSEPPVPLNSATAMQVHTSGELSTAGSIGAEDGAAARGHRSRR